MAEVEKPPIHERRISASQVSEFMQCPRKWAYKRLCSVPVGINEPLVRGIAVDTGLNSYYTARIHDLEATGHEIEEAVNKKINEMMERYPHLPIDWASCHSDAIRCIVAHLDDPRVKKWRPVGIQKEVTGVIGEREFIGYIDLIVEENGRPRIVDHKTSGSTPGQGEDNKASSSIQLWVYNALTGIDDATLSFMVPLKTKVNFVHLDYTKKPGDQEFLEKAVRRMTVMQKMMLFPTCDPMSSLCSPRYCDFWSVCRGSATGPLPIPGEMEV